MRIYLVSDLHVEFHGNFGLPPEPVDVVVLAGDIGTGRDILKVAARFRECSGAAVIIVLGNHEFYGQDYVSHLAGLRAESAYLEGVHLLECGSVEIGNVRFLGCTLWSDFRFHGQQYRDECKRAALQNIADFRVIKYGGEPFTPDHAAMLFRQSYAWLEAELATPFGGKTVVISHFLPHKEAVHPFHAKGKNPVTAYFTTACSDLMDWYPIDIWMYGHSHNSVDLLLENRVRLVSNQRGYPDEVWAYTRFDANKVIHLKDDPDYAEARRIECKMRLESRQTILAGARWLTTEAMAKLTDKSLSRVTRDLTKWSEERTIFSIYHHHEELYPDFIFDPTRRMRPHPVVAEVIQILKERRTTTWQIAGWFLANSGRLGGDAPKDLLALEPEAVLEAAHIAADRFRDG